MSLVFIGPPGAGKTRLGKRVAQLLGTRFIDTDKEIVAEHGPIADIFATDGETRFRELERAAVESALASDAVVALGGGAVLNPDTQRDLANRRVVLLTVSPAAVEARITGSKRPLLASGGMDAWKSLVDARMPIYQQLASRSWDTSNRPIDAIAGDIAAWAAEDTL